MRKVQLNGQKMNTRTHAHQQLKKQLKFPDYYGANLDALWDLLSTQTEPLQITLINRADLISALGDYGLQLIQLFKDAEQAHCHIQFRVMS